MPIFKADVTLHIHGSLTIDAENETEATNKIMDGHYALSDITIHHDEWEIDFMQEVNNGNLQMANGY